MELRFGNKFGKDCDCRNESNPWAARIMRRLCVQVPDLNLFRDDPHLLGREVFNDRIPLNLTALLNSYNRIKLAVIV